MSTDNSLNMETELELQLVKYMIPIEHCSNYDKCTGVNQGNCKLFYPFRKVTCSSQAFCTWKREYIRSRK